MGWATQGEIFAAHEEVDDLCSRGQSQETPRNSN